MKKKEIENLIEELKKELILYQKTIERKGISNENVELQINFYLEKLQTLLNKIKETD